MTLNYEQQLENLYENTLYLFTDGASRKALNEKMKRKTGRYGGEGIWLLYIDKKYSTREVDLSDYMSYTQYTNNDMELKAVVDGLKYLLNSELINTYKKITVTTDAEYVYNNRNRALFKWSKNGGKDCNGVGLIHKKLWKEFYKVNKSLYNLGVHCKCERVKGHNNNKYNEKADKSAVKGALSKKRLGAEGRRGVRMPFLKLIKFNDKIEINGAQELLVHVTNYVTGLGNGWARFICEIVDRENEYFRYRFYIKTNFKMSSRFIYKINLRNDRSHIVESINGEYSKKEIKEKMLDAGISEDIFYKKP